MTFECYELTYILLQGLFPLWICKLCSQECTLSELCSAVLFFLGLCLLPLRYLLPETFPVVSMCLPQFCFMFLLRFSLSGIFFISASLMNGMFSGSIIRSQQVPSASVILTRSQVYSWSYSFEIIDIFSSLYQYFIHVLECPPIMYLWFLCIYPSLGIWLCELISFIGFWTIVFYKVDNEYLVMLVEYLSF